MSDVRAFMKEHYPQASPTTVAWVKAMIDGTLNWNHNTYGFSTGRNIVKHWEKEQK